MRLALGVLVVLGLIACVVLADRRGRLLTASAGSLLALAAAWGAALLAFRADYHDADGWVDCWPSCTAFQDAVGATLVLGPPAAVVVLLAAAILAALRRFRPSRSS